MATIDTNPAPDNTTMPIMNSDPCSVGDAMRERFASLLREPTAAELAAMQERADEVAAQEVHREKIARQTRFREFIGDRESYSRCSFDGWKFAEDETSAARQREVTEAVREFASDVDTHRSTGTGAVFYGPPGTGKDYLATCIVRAACIDCGHTARFLNGVDWFVSLRDAMDSDGKSESGLIRECVRPDWLVLSDPLPPFGPLSPYQAGMLYRLIDERTSQRRPTIVTINVGDGAEATARLGGPTWDRLKHGAWVFACNWPSFRKPARIIG